MFEEEKEHKKKQEIDFKAKAREFQIAIERIAETRDGVIFFTNLLDAYFGIMRELNTGNSMTYTRLGYFDCFREFIVEPLMGANFKTYAQIEQSLMEQRRVREIEE